ncbi:MAG: FAD-dependent oxidoreductase [Pseudomonadota bacterium]
MSVSLSYTGKKTAAVIGAGLAGAACARALIARGFSVTLFDKGRGPGGRLSTRRAMIGEKEHRFDHGAQYLTARTDSFARFMADAERAGAASPWQGRLERQRAGSREPLCGAAESLWVGAGGMNAIVKHALTGLDVRFAARAETLQQGADGWTILFEDGGKAGPFDRVAVAIPAPQASALFASAGEPAAELAREAATARMAPCFAVMAAYDAGFEAGFDGLKLDEGEALSWAARVGSRPGADRSHPGWVLHAGPNWSARQVDADKTEIASLVLAEFSRLSGAPAPVWTRVHRWLYAFVENAAESPFGLSADKSLGAAGDWRLGPRAEHAWTSGLALGEALAGSAQG